MTTALTFPGQGSQAVGMGKALAEAHPAAAAVFQEVDEALGEKLSSVIFEGPIDTLTLTANAQPALMAVSLAAMRVPAQDMGGKADRAGNAGDLGRLSRRLGPEPVVDGKHHDTRRPVRQRRPAPGEEHQGQGVGSAGDRQRDPVRSLERREAPQ